MNGKNLAIILIALASLPSCSTETTRYVERWGTTPSVGKSATANTGEIIFSQFNYTIESEFARALESVEFTIDDTPDFVTFSDSYRVTYKINKGEIFSKQTNFLAYPAGNVFYYSTAPVVYHHKDGSVSRGSANADQIRGTLSMRTFKNTPTIAAEFYEALPVMRGYNHDFILQDVTSKKIKLLHKYYKNSMETPFWEKTMEITITSLPARFEVQDYDMEITGLADGVLRYSILSRNPNSVMPPAPND
jgi:hypothetical protein